MKVSAILFSLVLACQALPVTMHAAAAQADAVPANLADQFGPERLRAEYRAAVARLKQLEGKRLAYTYDLVSDTNMALAGGNAIKFQSKVAYAYDEKGRSRSVWSAFGKERIVIADPTAHAAYLVCPERKEILRLKVAALDEPAPEQAPAPQGTTADLGERVIAGVKAYGGLSEITIPAGAQGNDKPLVHKAEVWYAPDLATVVSTHMSMPELGDFDTHVDNLKFGDVPASLFALPDGYRILDIALHE